MATADPRTYLWKNICALMLAEDPSLDAVVKRTKIGRGTVQRIKAGDTATRLSSLEAIAKAFGIEVWQLLVKGLDPKSLPQLATAPAIEPGNLAARVAAIEEAMAAQKLATQTPSRKQRVAGAA